MRKVLRKTPSICQIFKRLVDSLAARFKQDSGTYEQIASMA